MNELNNILFAVYTTVLITIVTSQTPSNNTATASNSSENNYATSQKSVSSSQSSTKFVTNENRNLKVALTVDDPSFLKVKRDKKSTKGKFWPTTASSDRD